MVAGMDSRRPPDGHQPRRCFHFTEEARWPTQAATCTPGDSPLHTHSFVEIAFVIGGSGTHHSPGRPAAHASPATWCCSGPASGTATRTAERLELYNCCFSSELLRRELAWTREDPLLGYLLWTGPYSAQGRGMLHHAPGPSRALASA